eukprot:c10100_g1_i1.p1 GENE.c10100_g1_i1~~c10100_g1_i1.p1  ORF type:complete len:349 (-),score=96.22 c10100_g1_i1:125-1171(-)
MFKLGRSRDSSGELNKSKSIEDDLKAHNVNSRKELKLLLLGAGESGKSTIFKQIKIIHNHGFGDDERKEYVSIIRRHCIENFSDLVKGAEAHGYLTAQLQQAKEALTSLDQQGLTADLVTSICELWKTDEFHTAFENRRAFQLSDSAQYFFDNLMRITNPEYIPTQEDIIMCRVRTTGVSEMQFQIEGVKFRMVDVGGQRNERRKWIHFFDDVEAVIFVAAISEFDQVLFEDDTTNRLLDSIRLFSEICNTKFFAGTSMILFLNKNDLFVEKIKNTSLSVCFPEFEGGHDYESSIEFIKNKFASTRTRTDQEIFMHVTCATSTNNISFVFDAVKESVLIRNVAQSGFV